MLARKHIARGGTMRHSLSVVSLAIWVGAGWVSVGCGPAEPEPPPETAGSGGTAPEEPDAGPSEPPETCEPQGALAQGPSACDDDSSTPGDDRAGYLPCDQFMNPMTCGPGTICCISGCAAPEACARPQAECDGPEDCASGELCWAGSKSGGTCSAEVVVMSAVTAKCHTSADCVAAVCAGPSSGPRPCPVCTPSTGQCVEN